MASLPPRPGSPPRERPDRDRRSPRPPSQSRRGPPREQYTPRRGGDTYIAGSHRDRERDRDRPGDSWRGGYDRDRDRDRRDRDWNRDDRRHPRDPREDDRRHDKREFDRRRDRSPPRYGPRGHPPRRDSRSPPRRDRRSRSPPRRRSRSPHHARRKWSRSPPPRPPSSRSPPHLRRGPSPRRGRPRSRSRLSHSRSPPPQKRPRTEPEPGSRHAPGRRVPTLSPAGSGRSGPHSRSPHRDVKPDRAAEIKKEDQSSYGATSTPPMTLVQPKAEPADSTSQVKIEPPFDSNTPLVKTEEPSGPHHSAIDDDIKMQDPPPTPPKERGMAPPHIPAPSFPENEHPRSPPRGPRSVQSRPHIPPTGPASLQSAGAPNLTPTAPRGVRRPPTHGTAGKQQEEELGRSTPVPGKQVRTVLAPPVHWKKKELAVPEWSQSLAEKELAAMRETRHTLMNQYMVSSKETRRALDELEMSNIDLKNAERRRMVAENQLEKAKQGILGMDGGPFEDPVP